MPNGKEIAGNPKVHDAVTQHLQSYATMAADNAQLTADVQQLERLLHDEQVKVATLEAALKTHLKTVDWYSRNYAHVISILRVTTTMMAAEYKRAVTTADQHQMTEQVDDALSNLPPQQSRNKGPVDLDELQKHIIDNNPQNGEK